MTKAIEDRLNFFKERGINLISEKPRFGSEKKSTWVPMISRSIISTTPMVITEIWNLVVKERPELEERKKTYREEAHEWESIFNAKAKLWESEEVKPKPFYNTYPLEIAWGSFIRDIKNMTERYLNEPV